MVTSEASRRAQRVKALVLTQRPTQIRETLASEGFVNPATGKPYSLTTIRADVGRVPVAEMIGRVALDYQHRASARARSGYSLSVDRTAPDYAAWDKLRRGTLRGFEIGGLLCKPITATLTAFTLGKGLSVTLAEPGEPDNANDARTKTDKALEALMSEVHADLLTWYADHLGLGDAYLIVNADGSFSFASPDAVELFTDDLDYRKVVKVVVTTDLEKATVTDSYTEALRTVTIKWKRTENGHTAGQVETETFANLIGELPVVHLACERSNNEVYGHPIYSALYRLFSRYDDLAEKLLDGGELMGNPVPTFTGVEDVQKTLADLKTATDESYDDVNGDGTDRSVIRMDRLPFWILGKGGDAKFVSPQTGFSKDIIDMLGLLFILVCDYTRIPEFMYGASVEQSRASAETQLPPFIQYIDMQRARVTGDLLTLIRLWLKTKRLTTPSMVVDRVRITFPTISLDTAQVELQKTIYAKGIGGLTTPRAVELLKLVPDPHKDYALAQEELEQQAQEDFQQALNQASRMDMTPGANNGAAEQPNVTSGKPPLPAGGRRAKMQNGQRVGEMRGNGNGNGRRN